MLLSVIFYAIIGMLGLFLIVNRKKGLVEAWKEAAVILLNTVVLLVVLNIPFATYYWVKSTEYTRGTRHDTSIVNSTQNRDSLLRAIYHLPIKEIKALRKEVPLSSHPNLEFMETPRKSKYYNVGLEGMRYHSYCNNENAREIIDGSVWFFGGSTTFGDGVPDNSTIPAYLSKIDSLNTYVNFGQRAYIQNNEIEKLMHLLKKGYRPKSIIFLDGLNDIGAMFETNFHPMESPSRKFTAYNFYNDNPLDSRTDQLGILLDIPLIRFIKETRNEYLLEAHLDSLRLMEDLFNSEALYHRNPWLHFHLLKDIDRAEHMNLDPFKSKLQRYYKLNLDFLRSISSSFGFDFVVFIQPLGPLYSENPFISDWNSYSKSPLYKNASSLFPDLVALSKGDSNVIDISDAHCRFDSNSYVDLTHYSPRFSKFLAETILDELNKR